MNMNANTIVAMNPITYAEIQNERYWNKQSQQHTVVTIGPKKSALEDENLRLQNEQLKLQNELLRAQLKTLASQK